MKHKEFGRKHIACFVMWGSPAVTSAGCYEDGGT